MKKSPLISLLLLLLAINICAQPLPVWHRAFDITDENDGFYDIYAVEEDGYVLCGGAASLSAINNGEILVVRIDVHGNMMWSERFGDGVAWSIIEADNGDFVFGATGENRFACARITEDGERRWLNYYGQGECRATIELKNGNFLFAGWRSFPNRVYEGFLVLTNGDGDVIWSRRYREGDRSNNRFYAIRETDGGVVATGRSGVPWVVKIDIEDEGEVVWSEIYDDEELGRMPICESMDSIPGGGFILCGWTNFRNQNFVGNQSFLLKIDRDGEQEWIRAYNDNIWEYGHCVLNIDFGYVIAGSQRRENFEPQATRINAEGQEQWRSTFLFNEMEGFGEGRNEFWSAVEGHDNSIILAGIVEGDSTGKDGLVLKLEREQIEPIIFYWSPEDTNFTALRTDTTQFIVCARDQQGDEFSYMWIIGEDTLGHDSTVTKFWEEVGDYIVQCQASDGENISSINWHVDVTEFYINSHQPDSLNPSIRRNSAIDFSVTARAIENDPVEYLWLLNDGQIAENDSVTISFERGREHLVTAIASQGELADSVTWQVMVNDLIVDYMPDQLDLSVRVDTSFEFEVFPFNPNDDSLRFLWILNGDSISDNSWVLVNFDSEGLYNVIAYVSDTTESDSLTWTINVTTVGVHSDEPQHPDTPTLYPPVPNPFNSQTSISYQLPTETQLHLGLYDISGRQVMTLFSGVRPAGEWSVTLDGSNLASGLYFVRLDASEKAFTQKVMLVK